MYLMFFTFSTAFKEIFFVFSFFVVVFLFLENVVAKNDLAIYESLRMILQYLLC